MTTPHEKLNHDCTSPTWATIDQKIKQGEAALQGQDATEASTLFLEAYRLAQEDANTYGQIQCLRQLSKLYLYKKSYIDAAKLAVAALALYEAAVNSNEETPPSEKNEAADEERFILINDCLKVEHQFLYEQLSQTLPATIETCAVDEYRQKLAAIRQFIKTAFVAKQHSEQYLLREITEQLSDFSKVLIRECLSVVGEPPCSYAFVSLGSMARKEMNLYSDVEFAVLISSDDEANRLFFTRLIQLLEIKLIYLAETPCRVDVLRGDEVPNLPREGFHLDRIINAFLPFLVGTPAQLAALQNLEGIEQSALNGSFLRDPLKNVDYLMGDLSLVQEYEQAKEAFLDTPLEGGFAREIHVLAMLGMVVDLHEQTGSKTEYFLNIKERLYRLPCSLLECLAIYYRLASKNTWDRIDELAIKKKITKETAQHLKDAFDVIVNYRLKAQLHYQFANENFYHETVSQADSTPSTDRRILIKKDDMQQFAKLFKVTLSFYEVLKTFYESGGNKSYLETFISYDDSVLVEGMACVALFQFEKARVLYEQALTLQPEDTRLLSAMGEVLRDEGKSQEAIPYFEKALHLVCTQYGENHPFTTEISINLGLVHRDLGHFQQAITYDTQALVIRRHIYGHKHSNVAICLNNLGLNYMEIGHYQKALDYFEHALPLVLAAYGGMHKRVAIALTNFGIVYNHLEQLDVAIKYYQRALHIISEISGEQNLTYAKILINLAQAFSEADHLQDAIHIYKEVIQLQQKIYPLRHIDIAASFNNLGVAYMKVGEAEQAVTVFKQAFAICRQINKEKTPLGGTSLNNLGEAFEELKEFKQANTCLEQALIIRKALYPMGHFSTAVTLSNLAFNYQATSNLSQAVDCCKEAVQVARATLGHIHKNTQILENQLCACQNEQKKQLSNPPRLRFGKETSNNNNDFIESITLNPGEVRNDNNEVGYYPVIIAEFLKQIWFTENPDIEALLNKFIQKNFDHRDSESMLSVSMMALTQLREIYGDWHPSVARRLNKIGEIYFQINDHKQALIYFQRALVVSNQKTHGTAPLSNKTGYLSNLGAVHLELKNYQQAIMCFRNALSLLSTFRPQPYTLISTVLNNLGIAYEKAGQIESAEACFTSALVLRTQLFGKTDPCTQNTQKHLTSCKKKLIELLKYENDANYKEICPPSTFQLPLTISRAITHTNTLAQITVDGATKYMEASLTCEQLEHAWACYTQLKQRMKKQWNLIPRPTRSSNATQKLYQEAKAAATDAERYEKTKAFLHNPENKKRDFYKVLMNQLGEIFIERAQKRTANENEFNALLTACHEGELTTVRALIKRVPVNICNEQGLTPLHFAAGGGQLNIVCYLIEMGAAINMQDNEGLPPLYYAVRDKQPAMVAELLRAGANLNLESEQHCTLLSVAVQTEQADTVKYLLEANMNPNVLSREYIQKIIFLSDEIPEEIDECALLDKEINILIEESCEAPLHQAAHIGHVEIVKHLLQANADVHQLNHAHATPLHIAIEQGQAAIVELLIKAGAQFHIVNQQGLTPLSQMMTLAKEPCMTVCLALFSTGFSINTQDSAGNTLLHLAVLQKNIPMIHWLFLKGADSTVRNREQKTAEDLAESAEQPTLGTFMNILPALVQLNKESLTNGIMNTIIKLMKSPQNQSLHHKLACYYHVLALATDNVKIVQIAELYFKRGIALNKQSGICTEYANFLYKQQRHLEAIEILEPIAVSMEMQSDGEGLKYNLLNQAILPVPLQKEVEHTKITFPATLLAYYLLIEISVALQQPEKALVWLLAFQTVVEKTNTGIAYSLLGYGYNAVGQHDEANRHFDKAQLHLEATITQLENFEITQVSLTEKDKPDGELAARFWRALMNNKQLTHLKLQGWIFSETEMKLLAQCVANNPELEALHLDYNQLGDSGLALLNPALANSQLETLSLNSNQITAVGIETFANVVLANGKGTLKMLLLGNNRLEDRGLVSLLNTLETTSLESLSLAKNDFTPVGATALAEWLQQSGGLPQLFLAANPFGDEGIKTLAQALPKAWHLEWLVLDETNLGDSGLNALSEALPHMTKLRRCDLANNPRLTEPALDDLNQRLALNKALARSYQQWLQKHYLERAIQRYDQGYYQHAIETFQKILALKKDHNVARLYHDRARLADIHQRLENYQQLLAGQISAGTKRQLHTALKNLVFEVQAMGETFKQAWQAELLPSEQVALTQQGRSYQLIWQTLAQLLEQPELSPWYQAVLHGKVTELQSLLNYGYDINYPLEGQDIALHMAARYGNTMLVQWLLEHGAHANIKNNSGQFSADEVPTNNKALKDKEQQDDHADTQSSGNNKKHPIQEETRFSSSPHSVFAPPHRLLPKPMLHQPITSPLKNPDVSIRY